MGWLTEDEEGMRMEKKISEIINGLLLLAGCGLFVFDGTLLWIMFSPQIKAGLQFFQSWI